MSSRDSKEPAREGERSERGGERSERSDRDERSDRGDRDRDRDRDRSDRGRDRDSSRPNVYVGNISSRTRSKDLQYQLEKYGAVRRFDMKNGYAFVEFEESGDAQECIRNLDGYEMDGRKIAVERAVILPRKEADAALA